MKKHTTKTTKTPAYTAGDRQLASMIRLAAALLPKLKKAIKTQNPVAQGKYIRLLDLAIDAAVTRLDAVQTIEVQKKGEQ